MNAMDHRLLVLFVAMSLAGRSNLCLLLSVGLLLLKLESQSTTEVRIYYRYCVRVYVKSIQQSRVNIFLIKRSFCR